MFTSVEYAEEELLIPQWAIVIIVIGAGSLIFVVAFGVTVVIINYIDYLLKFVN